MKKKTKLYYRIAKNAFEFIRHEFPFSLIESKIKIREQNYTQTFFFLFLCVIKENLFLSSFKITAQQRLKRYD